MELKASLDRLHRDFGWKRLRPFWAKLEIVLGLTGWSIGMLLGIRAVSRTEIDADYLSVVSGVVLMVLGGYLAMAGHRSHLYQSNNKLAAWVVAALHRPDCDEDAED